MLKLSYARAGFALVSVTVLVVSLRAGAASVQTREYNPIPLQADQQILDTLSNQDIPLGQNGFARDYIVSLKAGDRVEIQLASTQFDTVVSLLAADGSTVGENDDGPDGTTNSLLRVRITKSGEYIVRVHGFVKQAEGRFTLKVMRLHPQQT